jgi:hypothetical protein
MKFDTYREYTEFVMFLLDIDTYADIMQNERDYIYAEN